MDEVFETWESKTLEEGNNPEVAEQTKLWTLPEYLEDYRYIICDIPGEIENLMNDKGSNIFNNAPRAIIIARVEAQVSLLDHLYKNGLLVKLKSYNNE